jgi:general secretion pathway protein A
MYTSFYGLSAKPFKISTDPTFLWLGEKHREAISMLKYGIQGDDHTGILLLTGDVGTGKTTLINALFKSLNKDVIRACVTNPNLVGLDFLNFIAAAYGSKKEFTSKAGFLVSFERFLRKAGEKNKKILLVVDEAQLLSHKLLEEIRLFLNIEKEGQSLIHIFLVGQQELRQNLSSPENRALRQRITLNYNIDALLPEETDEYIRYRLQVAGTSKRIFAPDAVESIHHHARGLPREINILCDHALLTGFVRNLNRIDASVVEECVKDISIVSKKRAVPIEDKPVESRIKIAEPISADDSRPPDQAIDEHSNHNSPDIDKKKKEPKIIYSLDTDKKKKNKQVIYFVAGAVLCLLVFAGYLLSL